MNEDLLLTDEQICKALCGDEYCMLEDMFPCEKFNYYKRIAQAQLDKIKLKQSEALQKYIDNQISFEKLAEELDINFYLLSSMAEKYVKE